jgi:hypothetical protein
VVYAIGTPIQPRRLGLGIGLVLLGMLAHGTWDAIAVIGGSAPIRFLGVIAFSVLALALLFVVMRKTGGQEREFLRAVLLPAVSNGTLTDAELDAVCAPRKQRKRFIRAGRGHRAHHNAKHVLHASFDLAHEITRVRNCLHEADAARAKRLDAVEERVHRGRPALDPGREAVAADAAVVGRRIDRARRPALDDLSLDAPATQRTVVQRGGDGRPDVRVRRAHLALPAGAQGLPQALDASVPPSLRLHCRRPPDLMRVRPTRMLLPPRSRFTMRRP